MASTPRTSAGDEQLWMSAVAASSMSEPCSMYPSPYSSVMPSTRTSVTDESVLAGNSTSRTGMAGVDALGLMSMLNHSSSDTIAQMPSRLATGRPISAASASSTTDSSGSASRPVSAVSTISNMSTIASGGVSSRASLVTCNLSNARLTQCPSDLPNNVVVLNLAFNNITSTSVRFFQPLRSLRVLDLSGNGIRMLPRDIGIHLFRLKELRLSKNRLEFIPPSIGAMESLELLDLGWNSLEMIDPRLFQNMKSLRHLWLQHNRLQTLPPSIGLLRTTLVDLLLDGNPFTAPMDELVAPLLLISGISSSTSSRSQRRSRDFGSVKGLLRKSTSVEGKSNTGRKHWQRARLALARSRTKSIATAVPLFQNGTGSTSSTAPSTPPRMPSPPPLPDLPSDYFGSGSVSGGEGAGGKASGRSLLKKMRKLSISGVRLDEMLNKINSPSAQAPPVPDLPLYLTTSSDVDQHHLHLPQSDSHADDGDHSDVCDDIETAVSDSECTGSGSWGGLRKPRTLGIDLAFLSRSANCSPQHTPQQTPSHLEDAYSSLQHSDFFFPHIMSSDTTFVLPMPVKEADTTADEVDLQAILRDSGYGPDARPQHSDADNEGDEEAMSSSIFSDGERAALETADDLSSNAMAEFLDHSDGVSEEVAALAAATKAACMRRSRNTLSATGRKRISLQAARDNAVFSVVSRSSMDPSSQRCSTSTRNSTAPTSPLANTTFILPGDSSANHGRISSGHEAGLDMDDATSADEHHLALPASPSARMGSKSCPSTPPMPAIQLPESGLDETTRLSVSSYGIPLMDSLADAGYPASINSFERYSSEERCLALRLLLGHLRDLWDLGVGLRVLEDESAPVRVLEMQQDIAIPDELIGNRPISLDVHGLLRLAERRRRIVDEIVATERTYVQELSNLERLYLRQAIQRGALTLDEVRTLFGNIESLTMFHREHFLPKLEEACMNVSPGNEPPIGQVFMDHCAYIKMYSVYVNNFEHAHAALDKWESSKSHKRWRQVMEDARTHRQHSQLNIQGYLVMPVQRIPRYRLLLQELFDHTPHSHTDYACLKAALDEVSKRADEINERKRDHEHSTMVLSLQKRIKGSEKIPLLQPHRRFVREFALRLAHKSRLQAFRRNRINQSPVVTIRRRRIEKVYQFFLFSDLLLQCKVSGHLNKDIDLVRCIRLGGRRDQVELISEEGVVRIVDEDAILYISGSYSELNEFVDAIAAR